MMPHIATELESLMTTELQEDTKPVEWANKWQMNFNVSKCLVMKIGRKNMHGNYS